jgi:hypothetical protein
MPVIISELPETEAAIRERRSSIGRLVHRNGASISALVDRIVAKDRALVVFLSDQAYLAEATDCQPLGAYQLVDLVLIQRRE